MTFLICFPTYALTSEEILWKNWGCWKKKFSLKTLHTPPSFKDQVCWPPFFNRGIVQNRGCRLYSRDTALLKAWRLGGDFGSNVNGVTIVWYWTKAHDWGGQKRREEGQKEEWKEGSERIKTNLRQCSELTIKGRQLFVCKEVAPNRSHGLNFINILAARTFP